MPSTKFYPSLTTLFPIDNIPENVGFIKDGIRYVFKDIYYRDLQIAKSVSGEAAFYNLSLVSYKRLGFDIPGTGGMALVINPDYNENSTAGFVLPISVGYKWDILKYIKGFSINTFDFSPLPFFNLLLDISGASNAELLLEAINRFYFDDETPIQTFVDEFNSFYSPVTPLEVDDNVDDVTAIESILEQFKSNGNDYDALEVIFTLFVTGEDAITIDGALSNLEALFFNWFGFFSINDIKSLLIPQVWASLIDINLALEFPRNMLVPLDNNVNSPNYGNPLPEPAKSRLAFHIGSVEYSTENGLVFNNESAFNFAKSQIGNTGMTLFFENAKLDLSRTTNIPEATAAGYPEDFVGVFVKSAEIGLPEKWFENIASNNATLGIFGENLLLGTGGISGTFGLRAIVNGVPTDDALPPDAEMQFNLGGEDGLVIGFSSFDFTLRQGAFVSTNITGSLTIPGFTVKGSNEPAKIGITMSFDKDGNFNITASEATGIPIEIPNVLTFYIKTLSVGRKDDKFYISTSGALDFTEQSTIGKLFKDPLEIDQLIVWQDGTIELKGLDGAFKLPEPKTLRLGPANITVTAIHFGTDEREHKGTMRKYWYFGFDGGISLKPGGVDARGDGVKVYFTVDNNNSAGRPFDMFFRIQSIAVDLVIPGSASRESAAVIINGYLSMKDSANSTEYTGGISLDLPKLRLSASAGMRLNPSVPAFLIDVSLNLPAAIPLGPTGVGIYGFRGLLGQKYVASRREVGLTDDSSWYEYYKKKVSPDYREGIQVSKFAQQDGFSVGAGVSLATAFDGGKVFSAKVFVLLSLPEVLLIQGQGAILKERIGLDTTTDPPFSAMISISSTGIAAEFGANIQIPEGGGEIAKISALAEMAFFFNNSGSWYLNIGRNQPEDKRVRAEILSLFNAYFYFMLSKQGIAAGAGAKWDFKKKLGPLRIEAGAYLDTAGKISFKPVQIGGSIAMGGYAGVYIWKIGLRIDVSAWLAAEAPKPFIITGGMQFTLDLPRPIKKLGGPYTIEFTWSFNRDRDLSEIPLMNTGAENDAANNVKAINRVTGETFPVYYSLNGNIPPNNAVDSYIIPVDSFIDVEFLKGMGLKANAGLEKFGEISQGSSNIEYVPPQRGKSEQVKHIFQLEEITISYRNGNTWADYDLYEAIRPNPSDTEAVIIGFPNNTGSMKYGEWQCETPNVSNKLRIFAKSPLSYITNFTSGPPSLPEDFGYREGFLFCEAPLRRPNCVTFPTVGQQFKSGIFTERQGILVRAAAGGTVQPFANPFSLNNALAFGGTVELYLPDPQAQLTLRLASNANEVRIKYFRLAQKPETGFSDVPQYEYVQITETTLIPTPSEKFRMISYKHTEHDDCEVDMVAIESIAAADGDFLLTENSEYLLQENSGRLVLEQTDAARQTQLFSICMLDTIGVNSNSRWKNQAQVDLDNSIMRAGFTTAIDPIWRPNTVYRIGVTTKDDLVEKNYQHTHYFFFKTAGPIGNFHKYNKANGTVEYQPDYLKLLANDSEDQFRLATLRPYIDYAHSYPNADGRLINAKPLFYDDPQLLLFYKQNTVYSMYNNFKQYGSNGAITSELQVLIKDPTEPLSANTEEPTLSRAGASKWMINPEPIMTLEVGMINNLALQGPNCSGFEAMTPLAVTQKIITGTLAPDRLYTAVFNAVYKPDSATPEDCTQVHSYVFKTSQYADFEEQVQSYILRDETGNEVRKAVFSIEKTFDPADMVKASGLVNGNFPVTDPLMSAYANVFDRLVDGVLQLGVMPPAATTDFTVVKNGSTIIGVIVRNPEPFNDPKMPENDVQNTIQLTAVNNTPVSAAKAIFSPDKTQAFVSNAALNIPAGQVRLTFRYKQYGIHGNTVGYATTETVVVEIEV